MEDETGSNMFRVSPGEAQSKQVNLSERFDTTGIDRRINAAAARLDIKLEEKKVSDNLEEIFKDRKKPKDRAKAADERLERRSRWRKAIIIAAVAAVVVLVLTK